MTRILFIPISVAFLLGAVLGVAGSLLNLSESTMATIAVIGGLCLLGWALPYSLAAFRSQRPSLELALPPVTVRGEPLSAASLTVQVARSETTSGGGGLPALAATAVVTAALILPVAQVGSSETERSSPAESPHPDKPATDTHD